MTTRPFRAMVFALGLGALVAMVPARAQQPSFQSTSEALAIDVNVLDGSGTPQEGLGPSDFEVRVDGRARRVLNVQWVGGGDATPVEIGPALPDGYASNQASTRQTGQLIVIAVDEVNLPPGALSIMQKTVGEFIDRIAASNPVAVVGLGVRSATTGFTTDRARLKQALSQMRGQQNQAINPGGFYDMGLSVAVRLSGGDLDLLDAMVARDCIVKQPEDRARCVEDIRMAVTVVLQNARQDGRVTESRLRDLLRGLARIDAPKTLVLFSQGFYLDGSMAPVEALASLAADARTTVYGLAIDEGPFARRRASVGGGPAADREARVRSLENLATATAGTFLTVTGNGAPVLDRVSRELAGHYLVGVEAAPQDGDGKPHRLQVEVGRKGLTVRARRSFVKTVASSTEGKTPREVLLAALQSPTLLTGLPLRAIGFAFRDADPAKVQVLVHAEVGTTYTEPRNIAIGFTVTDAQGHVVNGQLGAGTLSPTSRGTPSALAYLGSAKGVAPGEYTVKLAAADGDRVGTAEWTVRAGLLDLVEGLTCTDLLVGGPVLPVELSQPTLHSRVTTGTLQGYFELYGSGVSGAFSTTFEVAPDEQSPALLKADVEPMRASNDRAIFSRTMNVESLPPGMYVLKAVVRRDAAVVRTLTRAFAIERPPSAATPAATAVADRTAPAVSSPRFLPVAPARLARPFVPAQWLDPAVLATFRGLVDTEASRALFDEGVTQFGKGALQDAAATFKRAVRPDADPTAPMAYLAGVYAATGQDAEAIKVLRTALLSRDDVPELTLWLADALVRTRAYPAATTLLEDAVSRWPGDRRFLHLLALLSATAGNARDAADLLNRSIAANPDDVASLAQALEWLYGVMRDGQAIESPAEDLARARRYAEQYLRRGGPDEALVRRWQAYFAEAAR